MSLRSKTTRRVAWRIFSNPSLPKRFLHLERGDGSRGKVHLDNNEAERAIRPLAIGQKNWLFVGSEARGKAAAVLLSLVQSCREAGVNPREYLEDRNAQVNGSYAQKLDELLPLAWAASKKSAASQPG